MPFLDTIRKKMRWMLTRHPMLYYVRFMMVCRNFRGDPALLPAFGDLNRKEDMPALFFEVNKRIPLDHAADDFDKTLALCTWLRHHIKGGRGLGLSSGKALELMLAGKGGICSDYSQMLNVFCLINDIPVREWGTVERFYNPLRGHNYNEIYSQRLGKWVAIDFQKNLYFVKEGEAVPLSVIELFSYLRGGGKLAYVYFSDWRCIDMWKIEKTYSKDSIPFLIGGYVNKDCDAILNRYQDRWPAFVIHALMLIRRKNYHFLFVLDDYRTKFFRWSKKSAGSN
jgi:hypothetical protein